MTEEEPVTLDDLPPPVIRPVKLPRTLWVVLVASFLAGSLGVMVAVVQGQSDLRRAAEIQADEAVQVLEHRIQSELGRECLLNHMEALVIAALAREPIPQRGQDCEPVRVPELRVQLAEARERKAALAR